VDALLRFEPRTKEYLTWIVELPYPLNGYRLGTEGRQAIFSMKSDRTGTLTGKQQLILQGMLKAVGTKGYERATVKDAIDEAGVYRQAFYDSFRDKEDCYLQALDAGSAWIELEMREAAAGLTTWRRQLRGALGGLLGFLDREPEVGRALLVEVHAAGPRAVQRRAEAMERAAAMIDLAREESDGDAPAIASEAVVAGIHAVLHSRLSSDQQNGFLRLLPELVYLAVLPYFGADVAAMEMLGRS
jgi:AcrR family transcriptional regulator